MTLFNEIPSVVVKEEPWKTPAISPFEFINAITYTKENLIVDEWSEKQYNQYVINKGLSFGQDTIFAANAMNSRPHLDKSLQFSFYINIIRQRKRYNKWLKPEKIEALEVIKEYYGYSNKQAIRVLPLLDSIQINKMKTCLDRGGKNVG